MTEERPVDPRFDPRFQRGYDPATAPAPSSVPRPPDDEPIRVAPVDPALPVGQPRVEARPEPERLDLDDESDDELAEPAARNPFRLALLIVSIALLAIAAAMLWWTANNQSAYLYGSAFETAASWMVQQLMQVVPPAALVAGLLGLGAWLGLGALDALRAPEAPRHPEPEPTVEPDDVE
jgi:hypothetical protein